MLTVDLGIFAHNEAGRIATTLAGIEGQDIAADPSVDFRAIVLSNGSRDQTVEIATARASTMEALEVVDLAEGGKSRTWNRFVHDLSRRQADLLLFCDADIALPEPGTLARLCRFLDEHPQLAAASSQPVKDIVHDPQDLSAFERAVAASGGGLTDWRRSICGQLYAMRAEAARAFHLPIGLPVEDGFVRAMTLTRTWTAAEEPGLINGAAGVFHVYESERTIGALLRHQTRIVIGSAVNAAIYRHLDTLPRTAVSVELAAAAAEDGWLARLLRERLPVWPFGWVPLAFLTKRVRAARTRGGLTLRAGVLLLLGVAFDAVVYVRAQVAMARGTGAGHW
ncbi:MAG: glycosyltransferase [Pseudomonadota bacterium]